MFSRMKFSWLGVPVLAVAMMLAGDSPSAEAQGFSLQVGRFGISNYGHSGYHRGYRSYRSNYGHHSGRHYGTPIYGGSHRSYQSHRPHYDYHGPSLVPHGNHLDYVPGHYDLHYGSHHGGHFGH